MKISRGFYSLGFLFSSCSSKCTGSCTDGCGGNCGFNCYGGCGSGCTGKKKTIIKKLERTTPN